MTEDEAKGKACCGPQVIAMMIGLASPNMTAEFVDNPGRCCASACMAWRSTDNEAGPVDPTRDRAPVWRAAGYCGLAGRPE